MSRKKKQRKTLEELLEEALVPVEEQPYEVPENWVWVRLGSVFEVNMGQSPKGEFTTESPNGTIPLVGGPADMGKDYPNIKRYTSNPTKLTHIGDMIISVRATLGKTNFCDRVYCLGRGVAGLSSKKLNLKLLRYYLTVIEKYLYEVSSGTTFSQISRIDLINLPFPLPPLSEQKRIVHRVESLLGKIEEAKQLIEEARESYEQRRAAILAKAFRGELTKKWREQHPDVEPADKLLERIQAEKEQLETSKRRRKNQADLPPIDPPYELPKGWRWVRVGELFDVQGGGTPSKQTSAYWNGPIPWISPKDMKSRVIEETVNTITEIGIKNSTATLIQKGSVAIVVRSGILNRALPVAILGQDSTVNQDMKVFNSKEQVVNEYLYWYISGHQEFLLSKFTKSGTTVKSFLTEYFLEHLIPLPPKFELEEVLKEIEKLIGNEELIKKLLEQENQLNSLTQSILTKAFRGELGTNDPEEESAMELLKEVLAEKNGLTYEPPREEIPQVAEQGELYLT